MYSLKGLNENKNVNSEMVVHFFFLFYQKVKYFYNYKRQCK